MQVILMKIKAVIILFIIAVVGLSFGGSASRCSAVDYVSLGDSYASGQTPYKDPDGYGYSDMIRDKLDDCGKLGRYSKKGVSGYRTMDLLNQLSEIRSLLYDAEIVTVDIGINDILSLEEKKAWDLDHSAENLLAFRREAEGRIGIVKDNIVSAIKKIKTVNRKSGPLVYIMGYFDAFPDDTAMQPLIIHLNEAISEAANETGAVYVDTMETVGGDREGHLAGDIHPTKQGYMAIAEAFWDHIYEDLVKVGK